jgi:hypothetical protein
VAGVVIPDGRPMLSAPVSGFAAFVIVGVLDKSMPERIRHLERLVEAGRLHPNRLRELRHAHAAIRAAADVWRECAAADDSTAEQATADRPDSTEIDTTTAAELLGVSPNRVRQLARGGLVNGRRIGRTWLVERNSVEIRRMAAHE